MATEYAAHCSGCKKTNTHVLFQGPRAKGQPYREKSVCTQCLMGSSPPASPVQGFQGRRPQLGPSTKRLDPKLREAVLNSLRAFQDFPEDAASEVLDRAAERVALTVEHLDREEAVRLLRAAMVDSEFEATRAQFSEND